MQAKNLVATTAWLGLLLWGVAAFIEGGCSRRPVPEVPAEIPTTMPSEEEARRVQQGAFIQAVEAT